MNFFRSEEHIRHWLGERPPGATMSVMMLNDLATAWWADRLSPAWRPRTRDENQAILDGLGLTSKFWRLP